MMAPTAPAAPLTPEQLRSLVETSRRAKKIRRAATVARFGGWAGAVFAAITLASLPISFSYSTLLVGLGLAAAAAGEFHGAGLLSRLDPRAPGRLAINQALLAAVLVGYGAWCLAAGPPPLSQLAATGDPQMDSMVAGMVNMIHAAMYGTLIVVGVLAPALTAWYYLSRARLLNDLRASAEPTMFEALKAA